jgi:hypothetical protein
LDFLFLIQRQYSDQHSFHSTYFNTLKARLDIFYFIKNKFRSIQTTNPSTNKVVKSFDEMTDEKVEVAIEETIMPFFRNARKLLMTIEQKYFIK